MLALLVGAIPGLIAYFINGTWWVGLIVGGIFFIVMMITLLTFVHGLYLTFRSTVWTLTFRELILKPDSLEPAEPDGTEEPTDKTDPA